MALGKTVIGNSFLLDVNNEDCLGFILAVELLCLIAFKKIFISMPISAQLLSIGEKLIETYHNQFYYPTTEIILFWLVYPDVNFLELVFPASISMNLLR